MATVHSVCTVCVQGCVQCVCVFCCINGVHCESHWRRLYRWEEARYEALGVVGKRREEENMRAKGDSGWRSNAWREG